MNTIAAFEKVSLSQFASAWKQDDAQAVYDAIKLPRRATAGSAGYDFFAPAAFTLAPGETISIPTGIRAKIDMGWFLALFPRSGLGFKFRLQLNNTVGIIDSDYYNADNEGHIFIKLTNDSNEGKTVSVGAGEGFAQGIFLPFGLAIGDDTTEERHGGFGSTTK